MARFRVPCSLTQPTRIVPLGEVFRRALLDDAEGVWEALHRPNLQDTGNADEYFPVYFANAFARVGEVDEAIRWLEQAVSWISFRGGDRS